MCFDFFISGIHHWKRVVARRRLEGFGGCGCDGEGTLNTNSTYGRKGAAPVKECRRPDELSCVSLDGRLACGC